MGANLEVRLTAAMGICSDVTMFFQAVGRSEHYKKRHVMLFTSPFIFLFHNFLYKISAENRCHSSRINHFNSLVVGNNLFNLAVRNYGVGHVHDLE